MEVQYVVRQVDDINSGPRDDEVYTLPHNVPQEVVLILLGVRDYSY